MIDEYGSYRLRRFLSSGVLLVFIAVKVNERQLYESKYSPFNKISKNDKQEEGFIVVG